MSEGNSQSQTSLSRSRSVSQAGGVYDDGQDGMMMDDDWDQDGVERDGDSPSQEEDVEGHIEVEEGDEHLMVPTRPSYQACAEDEDFLAALDKMVNENIAESKNVVRDKNVMSSMTGPVSGAKGKKNRE